jgi:hypothetical protein
VVKAMNVVTNKTGKEFPLPVKNPKGAQALVLGTLSDIDDF